MNLNEDSNYSEVKGKTAEQILPTPGVSDGAALGGYLRLAASVRTNQELIDAHKELVNGMNKASADGSNLQRKIIFLTAVLAIAGVMQFVVPAFLHILSKPRATASELFDLQTKCGQIGAVAIARQKDKHFDNGRSATNIEYSLHYNQTTNHCYLDESGYLANFDIKGILHVRTLLDAQYGSAILTCTQLVSDASSESRLLIACQERGSGVAPTEARKKMDIFMEQSGAWPFQ